MPYLKIIVAEDGFSAFGLEIAAFLLAGDCSRSLQAGSLQLR
jgi:hypothetical protein